MWKVRKKLWIFKAIDRATGEWLACVCGDRSIATVSRLYEQLGHLRIGCFYTDGFEAFAHVFPFNQLIQSKKYTHAIERHNCITRHWLARMTRKTIAFSRCPKMVQLTLNLLAFYRFNNEHRMDELRKLAFN